MGSKRILVLSNDDFPYEGHGYATWKHLLSKGYETYYVCYESRFTSDSLHFIGNNDVIGKYLYRLEKRLRRRKINRNRDKGEYCLLNTSYHFYGDAGKILKKVGIKPDAIVFTWYDYFISPRTFYDLYQQTKAQMIVIMVDAHILGGGCHYPCDCRQFESGCTDCPVLRFNLPAKHLYETKRKYLSNIPLTIVGTPYDIQRANHVDFLSHAKKIKQVAVPEIPFILSKIEARKVFDLPENDFIVMMGAYELKDKRKGCGLSMAAIARFAEKMTGSRKMTLLMLGKQKNIDFDLSQFSDRINIVQPGFLDEKGLFTAYYASDLFISPSIDDSGPMMVNYSIACRTPVLSFPIGVAIDLVQHEKTGYIADFMSVESLEKGLDYFYGLDDQARNQFHQNCLSLMEKYRTSEENRPWYLQLFN